MCDAQRTATSRYTTAASATPDDLQCQICLGTLRACVALDPCGHNYCAACLSHHFAALLEVRHCAIALQGGLRLVGTTCRATLWR